MLQKLWSKKGLRFFCVGVTNTLIDLTILNTLVFLFHVPTLIANLISASISITTSYFLNHHLVFRSKEKHTVSRFGRFFVATGFGILAIQSLVIWGALKLLHHYDTTTRHLLNHTHVAKLNTKVVDLNLAKLLAVIVAMTWNFTIYHFVIFKTKTMIEEVAKV